MARQGDLSAQAVSGGIMLDEGMPHPLDLVAKGGKINGHFVGERPIELSINRWPTLDRNPRIVHAPVVLHRVTCS